MPLIQSLCSFALKQASLEGAEGVLRALTDRFSDQSQRLTRALQRANRRAWESLEIALAGESFWNRFNRPDDRAFRQQIRAFLDQVPLPALEGKEHYRRQCLQDLHDARGKGLLFGHLVPEDLAQRAGAFARFNDPAAVLQVERQVLHEMASELYEGGFKALGWLLGQAAHPGASVVVVAVRFFFRREVEDDEVLARGLQFEAVESLTREQQASFQQLEAALQTHGQRVEEALGSLLAVAAQTLGEVVEVRAEQQVHGAALGQIGGQVQALHDQMQQLLEHLEMKNQPVQAQHSLSIRNDRERQLVKELLSRYRALPEPQRQGAPELLNDVGKLQVAIGDFDDAQASFLRVAELTRDDRTRAEAHHNAYRAALECGDSARALTELRQAMALDPARFAPFPLDDYEPERILGAGGFGVTFLCRLRLSGGRVAVKALTTDGLERDIRTVMQEAAALDQLNHPSIIRLRHCGHADPARTRPYLVMEFFEGQTLEEYVRAHGGLPLESTLSLAAMVAQALQAAHGKGILHRDVKPANILVRRAGEILPLGGGWEVKLIDFGLALSQSLLGGSTLRQGKTIASSSIAGTLDYAAPEQVGKLPGVRIGPQADVYGFARTCCFVLFEAADPTPLDWKRVPAALADLLGHCLARRPEDRPANFGEVLRKLESLRLPPKKPRSEQPVLAEVIPEVLPEVVPLRLSPAARFASAAQHSSRHGYRDRLPFITTTAKRLADVLLAIVFGAFGAHKFSQGNSGAGWTRFFITCTCFGIIWTCPVGWLEGLLYLVKSNAEYDQVYLVEKRWWF